MPVRAACISSDLLTRLFESRMLIEFPAMSFPGHDFPSANVLELGGFHRYNVRIKSWDEEEASVLGLALASYCWGPLTGGSALSIKDTIS